MGKEVSPKSKSKSKSKIKTKSKSKSKLKSKSKSQIKDWVMEHRNINRQIYGSGRCDD